MKKIIISISEITYERLRFEALRDQKSVEQILTDRIFFLPFDEEIEEAVDALLYKKLEETI